MTTNNSPLINQLFSNLSNYLDSIKPVLYSITEEDRNNLELIDMLLKHKDTLKQIKTKLNSYSEDVNSTIQHIDEGLPLEHRSGGNRKKLRHTRKKRHSRKYKK